MLSTPVIKDLTVQIVAQFEEADHTDEAQAMLALTHAVSSRNELIDISHGRGVDYQFQCSAYQRNLMLCLIRPDQPLLPSN